MRNDIIRKTKKVVVKVGTNVLADGRGYISERIIGDLVRQISSLRRERRDVILVTSGAILAGMSRMRLKARPRLLPELQAAAAVGQSHLMQLYAGQFRKRGIEVAQILLIADDLKDRDRHLNTRNTIIALLAKGIVPIINENDTVSTEEIKFGDNDKLSALVANLVAADLLVILTDTAGLMTVAPQKGRGRLIKEVPLIGTEIETLARGVASSSGTGGMISKLQAVKIAVRSGESAIIANGREKNILRKIFRGESVGTFFYPRGEKLKGRKRWIAHFIKPKGTLTIDDGAATALLTKGKSLLAAGIRRVHGNFKSGDTVHIVTLDSREIARGFSNYDADDLRVIKGMKTSEIRAALGRKEYDEVIHRDNLALL
jgi:glutamate 5-kinase